MRARNNLLRSLDEGAQTVDLFFLPFEDRRTSEREYRVFCPLQGTSISALSKYRWHKPWKFADKTPREMPVIVSSITDGIRRIHGDILADLNDNNEMDRLLLKQGFSLDVFYDEECDVFQLVELNGFGARSSCGSCLFQGQGRLIQHVWRDGVPGRDGNLRR